VRANAETPLDAETARKFGAEGIGLCRTGAHVLRPPHRRGAADDHVETSAGRREALARLLPFQREGLSSTCSASWRGCR
jgi:pyruvate,orthophosphate dikinase